MADAADEGVAWESRPLPVWPTQATQPKWAWLEKRVLRVQTVVTIYRSVVQTGYRHEK